MCNETKAWTRPRDVKTLFLSCRNITDWIRELIVWEKFLTTSTQMYFLIIARFHPRRYGGLNIQCVRFPGLLFQIAYKWHYKYVIISGIPYDRNAKIITSHKRNIAYSIYHRQLPHELLNAWVMIMNESYIEWLGSGSQLGCRGTRRCHFERSRLPQENEVLQEDASLCLSRND